MSNIVDTLDEFVDTMNKEEAEDSNNKEKANSHIKLLEINPSSTNDLGNNNNNNSDMKYDDDDDDDEVAELNSQSSILPMRSPTDVKRPSMFRDRNEEQERMIFKLHKQRSNTFTEKLQGKMEQLKQDLDKQKLIAKIEASIELGELDMLKQMIENGEIEYNMRLSSQKSLLLFASQYGKLEIIRYLYHLGLSVNTPDQTLKTPLMRAAETKRLNVVKWLLSHGANVHAKDMFNRTAFELCVRSDAAPLKGEVLCLLATHYDQKSHHMLSNGLDKLFEMQRKRYENVDSPDTLRVLVELVILRSPEPLIDTIKFSRKFQILSEDSPSFSEEYATIAQNLTTAANRMVNNMSSDLVFSWLLEGGLMKVALRNKNNLGFFNNARVNRVLYSWWEGNGWQYRFKYDLESRPGWLDPRHWLRRAKMKFYLDSLAYAMFVLLFSIFMIYRQRVHSDFIFVEGLLYFVVAGHILREIHQLQDARDLSTYLRDSWNIMDMCSASGFLVVFILRVYYSRRDDVSELKEQVPYIEAEVAYRSIIGVLAVIMWSRLLFTTTFLSRLGPLLRVIGKIFYEDVIMSFTWVMLSLLIGFSIAFYHLVEDTSSNDSFPFLLFYLFQTFTGDIRIEIPDGTYPELQAVTMIFLAAYIFVTSVILLNLLIAMMALTYEKVHEHNVNEHNLSRAATVWTYDNPSEGLPPPFNLIVLIVEIIVRFFLLLTACFWAINPTKRMSCGHCGEEHDIKKREKIVGTTWKEVVNKAKTYETCDIYDREWIVQRYIQMMADAWYRDNNRVVRYAKYRFKLTQLLDGDICQKCCRLLSKDNDSLRIGMWKHNTRLFVFTVFAYIPMMIMLSPIIPYIIYQRRKYRRLRDETMKYQSRCKVNAKKQAQQFYQDEIDGKNIPEIIRAKTAATTPAAALKKQSLTTLHKDVYKSPHRELGVPMHMQPFFHTKDELKNVHDVLVEQRNQIDDLKCLVKVLLEKDGVDVDDILEDNQIQRERGESEYF